MKLFTKIRQTFKRFSGIAVAAVVIASLTALPFNQVRAEFYPDRPTYNYNDPAQRVGSTTGPVFNSFINTPSYGDERAFFDARRSEDTAAGSFHNVLNNVSAGTKEYVLRMYIHNNANQSTNGASFDGPGVATGSRVRVYLPTATATSLRARAYISASNASTVEDTVDFTDSANFKIDYVPGSAVLYNNGPFSGGQALSDSIVAGGATIGHTALDGRIPGCFDYEAIVQIRIKITPATTTTTPNTSQNLTKKVRKAGETAWVKEVKAKPGETVEWLLTSDNIGSAVLNNITIRDVLPPNVKLVPGSVRWIDAVQNAVQQDAPLFGGGINVGNYAAGSGFYVMFKTTVLDNFSECQVRNRNLSYVKSTETPTEVTDSADVIITKDNCNPPAKPPVKPAVLPNTGTGSVLGIFAAVTLAGAAFHRFVLGRKIS